jgi:hypothetical protein
MRLKIQVITFTGILLFSCNPKTTVVLTVQSKKPYCGGARPTQEILNAAEELRPYRNKWLLITDKSLTVDSVMTDSSGQLTLRLKKGVYRVMEPWRFFRAAPGMKNKSDFEQKCLENEWKQDYCVITVRSKETVVSEPSPIVEYCAWRLPCKMNSGNDHIPD